MDIDIDLPSNFVPKEHFKELTYASMVNKEGKLVRHQVGTYFQNIPKDPLTGLSAIPHRLAEELGYFKIDFLHLETLNNFISKKEIRQLIKIPPNWNLLQDEDVVKTLFHVHRHFDILQTVKPRSIEELADCVALKLPRKPLTKYALLEKYLKNREAVRDLIYSKPPGDGTYFKRGHAIAYAMVIILQLHLIDQN